MFDLYKLEIFINVVEAGSFSAAGERLLMSQSGVSQHIKDLETGLGTTLFRRERRGVALTPSGDALHSYAQQIFRLVAEAENAVTDVSQLAAGQVRIGATPGVSIYVLDEWVQTFRDRYPNLTLDLQTKITPQIVQDLLGQRLDIGLVEGELAPGVEASLGIKELEVIEQFVVVGKGHPLWERREVAIRELDGQMFIMRQPASQTSIWLNEMLERYHVRPRIGAEFDNVESIKRSIIRGKALAILPEYAVRDEQAFGVLRLLPIVDSPLQRIVKLIWDRRRYFSPVTRSFLVHLQGYFPALHELSS